MKMYNIYFDFFYSSYFPQQGTPKSRSWPKSVSLGCEFVAPMRRNRSS